MEPQIKTPKDVLSNTMFSTHYEPIKQEEFPDEEATCEKHGKYIVKLFRDFDDKIVHSGCPECIKERHEAKIKRERELEQQAIDARDAAEKKQKHIEYCKSLNIEPEFYFSELDDYIAVSPAQKCAKEAVERMIKTRSGKIVMLGNNGVGKSMLANIAAKKLGGKVYTVYEIATMIRQSYSIKTKTELEIVDELASIPFLAIDEVGRVANSESVMNWFSHILVKRHLRDLPFMLIGNLHFQKDCEKGGCPKCFENYFDKDVLSRLKQISTIVEILAGDKRSEERSFNFISDRNYKECV